MAGAPDHAVEVTWTKDARRLRPALSQIPTFRRLRLTAIAVTAVSAAFAAAFAIGGIRASLVLWMALPPVVFMTIYAAARGNALRGIGTGSLTWRFDPGGLRITGDTTNEIPWPRLVRWYRRADHLIVEVRRSSGRQPPLACLAPLSAFDASAWEQVEAMLRAHLGPEGDPSS